MNYSSMTSSSLGRSITIRRAVPILGSAEAAECRWRTPTKCIFKRSSLTCVSALPIHVHHELLGVRENAEREVTKIWQRPCAIGNERRPTTHEDGGLEHIVPVRAQISGTGAP
ncbi:uncharacterized protein TrAFT101_006023 [Trichoderma asperellum]|uniref:uncharacterized protein n=1 Tax=Trichoderma asperellum TaxID=101201 RepID=UPI00332FC05B|nr:hypothetical protein TrAFT101_006023 [Trichoderma asperellum]